MTCSNGELVTTNYSSPIPVIGFYIAVASLVCFISISFDLLYAFMTKKQYLPCKLFSMNSFTMTVVAVATKIPGDLTTPMPRGVDQLSKLTGTAFLCISMGYFLPSLGSMSRSERYANMAALSVMVISTIVNTCIQISTGVMFAFHVEHIVVLVCMSLMLFLLWNSSLMMKGQRGELLFKYNEELDSRKELDHETDKFIKLTSVLEGIFLQNYCGNPQLGIVLSSPSQSTSVLCALPLICVVKAGIRSLLGKDMRFCGGTSDYGNSVIFVVVVHILTILVGILVILYRSLFQLIHRKRFSFLGDTASSDINYSLFLTSMPSYFLQFKIATILFEYGKFLIVYAMFSLQVVLLLLIELLRIPFYILRKCISIACCKIACTSIQSEWSHNNVNNDDTTDIKISIIMWNDSELNAWVKQMAMKDIMRGMKLNKEAQPIHLIHLLSTSRPPQTQFLDQLLSLGSIVLKGYSDWERNKYRVSCVSYLALGKLINYLVPHPLQDSLFRSFTESFELVFFVDKRTNTPTPDNEERWDISKYLWLGWDSPVIWSRFKMERFQNVEDDQLQAMRDAFKKLNISMVNDMIVELEIITEFILQKNCASLEERSHFIKQLFVEMLCYFLSKLPSVIYQEVNTSNPFELSEGRVRRALKFMRQLESLAKCEVEWLWPSQLNSSSQVNPPNAPSEPESAV